MKKQYFLFSLTLVATLCASFFPVERFDVRFAVRVISSGLSDPWSIVSGPDGMLWVTESKTYRVIKVNPASGNKTVVLDLRKESSVDNGGQNTGNLAFPQGGLLGLALHPQFSKGYPFVYVAFISRHLGGHRYNLSLARFRYNKDEDHLDSGLTICDTIPASNDHNGGRLLIAPVEGKPYLFYSVGDMGSGQFSNGGVPNNAQNVLSYEGKVLRYHLEETSGWIPRDNPFGANSAVWTVGHRNPQGLAFTIIGDRERLYSAEHGPYSDDEVNLLQKGHNYGHPLVIGYPDGNYDGLAASVSRERAYPGKWHTTYPLIRTERRSADSIGSTFSAPVMSFNPTSRTVLGKTFRDVQSGKKVKWQSEAPSGIAIYSSNKIPGWQQSLLITSLKNGRLLRLKLNENGTVHKKIYSYLPSRARYRDVAVSGDGARIYLATDSSSVTSGPTKKDPKENSYRGCILELQYIE